MPKVLYRADGGHPLGTGHLLRALRISACWAESAPDVEVLLVARDNPALRGFVSDAALQNLRVHFLQPARLATMPRVDAVLFQNVVQGYRPDIVVVDMLDTPANDMRLLADHANTLVTLDDRGDGRLHAHLVCNFLVRDPDPSALDSGRTWLREGPEYASLPSGFAGVRRNRREPEVARRALVTLGGADAAGLTVKVAEALMAVSELSEVEFVVGAAFSALPRLERVLDSAPWHAVVRVALPTLLPIYGKADIAIVAGGITMHEVACCGVPAVAVCQPIDHQLLVASWLEQAGCMVNAGFGEDVSGKQIAAVVRDLCVDQKQRQAMSDAGPAVCDGRGSQRVATLILERWNDRG